MSSQTQHTHLFSTVLVQPDLVYFVSVSETHLTVTPIGELGGTALTRTNNVPSELHHDLDSIYGLHHVTVPVQAITLHLCPFVQNTDPTTSVAYPLIRKNQVIQFFFPSVSHDHLAPSSTLPTHEFLARLRSTIESRFPPLPLPPYPVHVFLNPVSGPRQARAHYDQTILPMLLARGHAKQDIRFFETTSKESAKIEAGKIELQEGITGAHPVIICIGGDGVIHEVINGVAEAKERADAASRSGHAQQRHRVKIGVVPAGTGNALATSLGIRGIDDAVFRIIRGSSQPLNTIRVSFGTSPATSPSNLWHDHVEWTNNPIPPRRLFVVFSWGFHAQVVAKSEWLRFLGNSRFQWTAKWLIATLAQYAGSLRLSAGSQGPDGLRRFDRSIVPGGDFVDVPEGHVDIDDNFTYFLCSKQAELEPGFRVAPFASAADRWVDVLFFRNVTRSQLIEALVKAQQGGVHVRDNESVEYYKAREIVLRVGQGTELCLDGEVVSVEKNGVVKIEVVEGAEEEGLYEVLV